MEAPPSVPPTPKSSRGAVLTAASTSMRRRVMQSAALGEWEAVYEAVDKLGCNVNIKEEESGLSLVHWAAHQGKEECLRWLLDHGAFSRPKDARGEPPLTGARGACTEMLLKEAYSLPERVLYEKVPLTEARLEAVLGAAGVEVLDEPLPDEDGATLLVALAGRHGGPSPGAPDGLDAVPLIRWLTGRGVNLEAADEDGNAILHMVDWSLGFETLAPLLRWALMEVKLEHKDARNNEGETPALLCAYSSPTGEDARQCLDLMRVADVDLTLHSNRLVNIAMALARYQGDGPWLAWCFKEAGIQPSRQCKKGRTAADYVALHGAPESDEEAAG